MSMTLQNIFDTKEQARASVQKWRDSGFTAKIKQEGNFYKVYVGSFGARYKKMKRLARGNPMAALPVRIPEKVLAWRERQRKGSIMRPRTFKKITKEARKRYARKRAGPATGGKAYWITTLRKYLDTHPRDLAATRALKKLTQRRYRKNPSKKWYIGYFKVSRGPQRGELFTSSKIPTASTHGKLYSHVIGPFNTKGDALRRYYGGII